MHNHFNKAYIFVGRRKGGATLWNFNNGAKLRRLKKMDSDETTDVVFAKYVFNDIIRQTASTQKHGKWNNGGIFSTSCVLKTQQITRIPVKWYGHSFDWMLQTHLAVLWGTRTCTLLPTTHFAYTLSQTVTTPKLSKLVSMHTPNHWRRRRGCKRTPKSFDLMKIGEKSVEI